jgi:hypothetical protein
MGTFRPAKENNNNRLGEMEQEMELRVCDWCKEKPAVFVAVDELMDTAFCSRKCYRNWKRERLETAWTMMQSGD